MVIARTNGVAIYAPLREFNACALLSIYALNASAPERWHAFMRPE
jgi:hypothetical protein